MEQRADCLYCCCCTSTMMVISLSQGSLFCNIPLMIILRRYSDSPKYCQDVNTSSHNCVLATFSSLMENIFLIVIIISTILEQRLLSLQVSSFAQQSICLSSFLCFDSWFELCWILFVKLNQCKSPEKSKTAIFYSGPNCR